MSGNSQEQTSATVDIGKEKQVNIETVQYCSKRNCPLLYICCTYTINSAIAQSEDPIISCLVWFVVEYGTNEEDYGDDNEEEEEKKSVALPPPPPP